MDFLTPVLNVLELKLLQIWFFLRLIWPFSGPVLVGIALGLILPSVRLRPVFEIRYGRTPYQVASGVWWVFVVKGKRGKVDYARITMNDENREHFFCRYEFLEGDITNIVVRDAGGHELPPGWIAGRPDEGTKELWLIIRDLVRGEQYTARFLLYFPDLGRSTIPLKVFSKGLVKARYKIIRLPDRDQEPR